MSFIHRNIFILHLHLFPYKYIQTERQHKQAKFEKKQKEIHNRHIIVCNFDLVQDFILCIISHYKISCFYKMLTLFAASELSKC